jgi:hypothetical protein
MRGKTAEEIASCRKAAIKQLSAKYGTIEVLDTYFKDFEGNRIAALGKSIAEGLSRADLAVFADGWSYATGCLCEHYVATAYNVPVEYVDG